MVTYILSQHQGYWHVVRYAEETAGEPVAKATFEREAIAAILKRAETEQRYQILKITPAGDSHILARSDV